MKANHRAGRVLTLVLTAAGALCIAGCVAGVQQTTAEPPGPTPAFTRVAVVQFFDESNYDSYGYGMKFARALTGSLARHASFADVFAVSRDSLESFENPFETGKMPLDVLVSSRSRNMADLAVVGCIHRLDPYRMPSVGVAVKVLETRSGRVLFSLSGDWDAANHATQRQVEAYCRQYSDSQGCRYGAELFYNSPLSFLRFAADDLAKRITTEL